MSSGPGVDPMVISSQRRRAEYANTPRDTTNSNAIMIGFKAHDPFQQRRIGVLPICSQPDDCIAFISAVINGTIVNRSATQP